MRTYENHSLLSHNTFGIDVKCRQYIEVSSASALERYVAARLQTTTPDAQMPLLCIGSGSNILFTADYNGIVLHSSIKGTEVNRIGDYVLLRCGSGEKWDDIVQLCIDNGWHGSENLSLIPGEIGAAAVQNIGAYGCEIKDLISTIDAIDLHTGQRRSITAKECQYGYRQSLFKTEWQNRYFITHVTLRLSTTFTPNIHYKAIADALAEKNILKPTPEQLRETVVNMRRQKLPEPKQTGNAGSFFKNPVVDNGHLSQIMHKYHTVPHHEADDSHAKIPAAWLIEQCGWKGGGQENAAVWAGQPLVIVNLGEATGQDILHLAQDIMEDVKNTFGIQLEPEVLIL